MSGAIAVTTKKDAVRLAVTHPARQGLVYVPTNLEVLARIFGQPFALEDESVIRLSSYTLWYEDGIIKVLPVLTKEQPE